MEAWPEVAGKSEGAASRTLEVSLYWNTTRAGQEGQPASKSLRTAAEILTYYPRDTANRHVVCLLMNRVNSSHRVVRSTFFFARFISRGVSS